MQPKIVYFDLEIIPDLNKALEYWTQLSLFPGKTMKATVGSICSAGYIIEGEFKRAKCINAWDYKGWKKNVNDDKKLCEELYEILHDADAIVTYNGKRFDFPYLQTRLMHHGLKPLDPKIRHIDLYQVVRRATKNINNKLDTVSHIFLDDRKQTHTGWKLWVDTHNRVQKAMTLMDKYCKQDVNLLPKLKDRFRPFINNWPNMNLYRSDNQLLEKIRVCPVCAHTKAHSVGWRTTKTQRYQRVACLNCGKTYSINHKGNVRD